jgi:hypothetical protein
LEQTPHDIFHKALFSATEVLLTKLFAYTKENGNPEANYCRVFLICFLVQMFDLESVADRSKTSGGYGKKAGFGHWTFTVQSEDDSITVVSPIGT